MNESLQLLVKSRQFVYLVLLVAVLAVLSMLGAPGRSAVSKSTALDQEALNACTEFGAIVSGMKSGALHGAALSAAVTDMYGSAQRSRSASLSAASYRLMTLIDGPGDPALFPAVADAMLTIGNVCMGRN